MKLLSLLQRGSKKSETTSNQHDAPSTTTNSAAHNNNRPNSGSNNSGQHVRGRVQRPSGNNKAIPNIIPNQHHQRHESHSSSNNSIFSLPTQGYDDHTIDANTLYEWSVADNAPSVGSIADLFLKDSSVHGTDNDVENASKKEQKSNNHKPKSKLGKMVASSKKRFGYGSSSDDDDDGHDEEDDHDNVVLEHFQYCKLSDSPPRPINQGQNHTNNTSFTSVDHTPIRKGKGTDVMMEKMPSPSKIQPRQFRNGINSIPIQALRNVTTTAGNEEPKVGEERTFCPELKGRIHAVNFDAKDENERNRSYDQSLRSSFASPTSSVDDASIQNVGNANSPFHHYVGKDRRRMEDLSMFDSTRNLGDANISPGRMYGGRKVVVDVEPEFTFSITQEDLFGSDVESTWLLNDGDSSDETTTSDDDNGHGQENEKVREQIMPPSQNRDSLKTFTTDGAVADDESSNFSGKWRNSCQSSTKNESSSNPVTNHKFRSKVRNQVKNKFKSIVKKKTKGQDDISVCAIASQAERRKLNRQSSELSTAPLTGIEDHSRLRLVGKSKRDKELSREVERRKEIERRDIARRMQQRKEREEQERMRRKQLIDVEKWKANAVVNPKSDVVRAQYNRTDQLDEFSRKKLQARTQGNSTEGIVAVVQNGISAKDTLIETQHVKVCQSAPYDELSSTATGKSFYTCLTTRIDNTTTKTGNSRHHITTVPDFDPYFPDEDSTTQTPEASAPMTHDFSCVMCKSGERTHLAVPCMHFSFCGDCVSILEKQSGGSVRCAVCNEKAEKFSKVFY